MITTTTTCDRCGRQRHDPLGMPDVEGVKLSPFGGPFLSDLHFCGDCTRAFCAWIEAGPQPTNPAEPEPGPVRLDPSGEQSRRGRRERP